MRNLYRSVILTSVVFSALSANLVFALSMDGARPSGSPSPAAPVASPPPMSQTPVRPSGVGGSKPILQNPSVEDVKKNLGRGLFKGPKTKDLATTKAIGFGTLVQFATDSTMVIETPNLRTILSALLDLESYASIMVTGHTDNIGGDAYNIDLSRRRAEAVRRWLEANGVRPGAIRASGMGFHQPVDSNATEQGRQNNRRVDFSAILGEQ